MRVEQIGDCALYLGDCREIIGGLAADAIITDPVWPNCPKGLLQGSDDPHALWRDVCAAMQARRWVVVMRHDSDPRFLAPVPLPYARSVILPYVMPGYIGRYLGGDEIAYCFGEPISSRPGQRVIPGRAPAVQPSGRRANGHPCSRALAHFEFLARWWSEPGETVLDPFMGSGTTGVACAKLGRSFVGIEIEPKYFDIACRRIDDAYKQPRLFTEPKAVQQTINPEVFSEDEAVAHRAAMAGEVMSPLDEVLRVVEEAERATSSEPEWHRKMMQKYLEPVPREIGEPE